MDPLSLAIAGGGVISSLIGGNEAKKASQAALAQQLRMFEEQMRFAKAGRTDAYGNKISFNDALNEWITQLTPQQKRLLSAGERESLLSLTEDAARNRNARRRQEGIGKSATEDYNTLAARYHNRGTPSEGAILDDLTSLIAYADRGGGNQALNQSLRTGGSRVRSGPPAASGGSNLGANLLKARQAALDEYTTRAQGRNSELLPGMQFFAGQAGGGGGAPITYSDTPKALSGTQDAMAQLIAQVGQAGAANVGKAQQGVVEATSKQFPSITDASRLITSLRGQPTRYGSSKSGVAPIASSTSWEADSNWLDSLLAGGIY